MQKLKFRSVPHEFTTSIYKYDTGCECKINNEIEYVQVHIEIF